MNITLVNTNDIQGGAARAVYRLHQGLTHIGQKATLLCHKKASNDPNVVQVQTETELTSFDTIATTCMESVQSTYIDHNRSDLSNTFFSMPYPGIDLSDHPAIQQADVINLHWIARFQSPSSIKRLLKLGKPVIWTLHDTWAFTGGCHYTAGCLNYQQDCRACPQLGVDAQHLTTAVLMDKLKTFQGIHNLTIVTPSRWLSDCAKHSRLFQGLQVETIPNSLETEVFHPIPKVEAKAQLDINPDVTTIMFGAVTAAEERKGFSELIQALWHCLEHPQFRQQVEDGKIAILCAGYPSDLIHALGIPVCSWGYVDSDDIMSQIYAASDLFLLPSLEDNLPNTMLEAMSCGTPVVAFEVGGIPDVVSDRVTGRIVPLRDVVQLANAILDCVFDPHGREHMGVMARQTIIDGYTLSTQAQGYVDLFQALLHNPVQVSMSSVISGEMVIQEHTQEHTGEMSSIDDEQPQVQVTEPVEPLSESAADAVEGAFDTAFGQEFGAVFDAIALNATASHLQQIKKDFHKLQTQFHNSQEQLQQTQEQLQQTQEQLQQTQEQLQQSQEQLQQSQEQLQQSQEQFHNSQEQLQQTQEQLQQTQDVQMQSQSQINELREQFQQIQNRLQQTQKQLTESQQTEAALTNKIDVEHRNWKELLLQEQEKTQRIRIRLSNQTGKLKQRLQRKISELEQCQETITEMETSKFWKLRNRWFKLKQKLGMDSTR